MKNVTENIINSTIQAPWWTYYNKVKALLGNDTDLSIGQLSESGEKIYSFNVDSTNTDKIIALQKIFKTVIPMGNITLKINFNVINDGTPEMSYTKITAEDFRTAFNENPIVDEVNEVSLFDTNFIFVIFKKKIIQFYNDDITDYWGNYNGLAEDIAREVFTDRMFHSGFNYCTNIK